MNTEIEGVVGNVVYEEIKTYFEENPAMAKKIIEKSITATRRLSLTHLTLPTT